MKKILFLFILALSFNVKATESIENNNQTKFYLEGEFDRNFIRSKDKDNDKDKYNYNGFGLSFGLYNFSELPLRTEIKYHKVLRYSDSSFYDQETDTYNNSVNVNLDFVMFNLYYDFLKFNKFIPYVGLGLGFAIYEQEINYSDSDFKYNLQEKESSPAVQLIIGSYYKFNDSLFLNFSVKNNYFENEPELKQFKEAFGKEKINTLTFSLGLRYNF